MRDSHPALTLCRGEATRFFAVALCITEVQLHGIFSIWFHMHPRPRPFLVHTAHAAPLGYCAVFRLLSCVCVCVCCPCGQATENVERFHLFFALQLVRCPFLNPRIRGVTILSEIIDITVRSGMRREILRAGAAAGRASFHMV